MCGNNKFKSQRVGIYCETKFISKFEKGKCYFKINLLPNDVSVLIFVVLIPTKCVAGPQCEEIILFAFIYLQNLLYQHCTNIYKFLPALSMFTELT